MFNNDQWSSLFWLVFGMVVVFFSIPYGIGSISFPEVGFMPFLIGVVICLLAIAIFIEGTKSNKIGIKWNNPFVKIMWWKPLLALGFLMIYALILNTLGYLLCTILLIVSLIYLIEPQRWFIVFIVAILTSLISYLIFKVWLETQLPLGSIWGL